MNRSTPTLIVFCLLIGGCRRDSTHSGVSSLSDAAPPMASTPQKPMLDSAAVADRLRAIDPELAEMASAAEITVVPTPFFTRGAIVRVTRRLPTHPVVFTVGMADPDFTALLAGQPDHYADLAAHAGLSLEGPANRLAYAVTYLETTRSFGRRFQVLSSVDELTERSGLGDDEKAQAKQLKNKYRSTVVAPKLEEAAGLRAVVFAVRDQALVRIDVSFDDDGRIRSEEKVLEDDLPIPYAR